MKVKNNASLPVQVGRDLIPAGEVRDIEDAYIYQPRTIRLKEKGVLEFPYCEKRVLDIFTQIGSPSEKVEISPKAEESPPADEEDA